MIWIVWVSSYQLKFLGWINLAWDIFGLYLIFIQLKISEANPSFLFLLHDRKSRLVKLMLKTFYLSICFMTMVFNGSQNNLLNGWKILWCACSLMCEPTIYISCRILGGTQLLRSRLSCAYIVLVKLKVSQSGGLLWRYWLY